METVPVRGMPSERTCMGTVRTLSRLFLLDSLIMGDCFVCMDLKILRVVVVDAFRRKVLAVGKD